MPIHPITKDLQTILKGETCTSVELLENVWKFDFAGIAVLMIETYWRVVTPTGIAVTDGDHKQLFGLQTPIDAAHKAHRLLSSPVANISVDAETADLHIKFENSLRLEVWTSSSGYESWHFHTRMGLAVHALGGGGISLFGIQESNAAK